MGIRRRGRESAFQLLYQLDISGSSYKDVADEFFSQMGVPHKSREFMETLVLGTLDHLNEVDHHISAYSHHWKLHRMDSVDKNVLRLGVYELCFRSDIPTKVIINEAIEIGKKYGTEESSSFINGILDKIAREVRGEEKQGL